MPKKASTTARLKYACKKLVENERTGTLEATCQDYDKAVIAIARQVANNEIAYNIRTLTVLLHDRWVHMQCHSKTYEAQQSPIDKFCIDIARIIGGKDYKTFLAPGLPMTSTELRTTNPNAFLIVDGNRVDVMELIDQGLDRAREDLHPPLNIPAQAKKALFTRIPEMKQIEAGLLKAMEGENDFLPLLTQLGTALKEKNETMCSTALDQFNDAFDTLTDEEQDTIKGYHVTSTKTFGQVLVELATINYAQATQVTLGDSVLAMAKEHHRYLDELAYLHVTPYQDACELAYKVKKHIGKPPLTTHSMFVSGAKTPPKLATQPTSKRPAAKIN